MKKANLNLIRRMLKEALSFYTYLKNSNKKWVFKSKSGNYPSNYDPRKHSKAAVTEDAKQEVSFWLAELKAERDCLDRS